MIFLNLHKVYDALDRSRCLEILEGYGVGPKARRLLTNYWRRLRRHLCVWRSEERRVEDYRGIGLVEVMWKVVAVIRNRRFTSSITYHNALHGFRAGCVTGTVTLEDKLLQQLVALRE